MNPARAEWDAETAFLVALMSQRGVGPRTLARVLVDLGALDQRLGDLVRLSSGELRRRYEIDRVPSREDLGRAHRDIAEMQARGIAILRIDDPSRFDLDEDDYGELSYPAQLATTLGAKAPPVLFAAGELSLLARPGVGFCGSREASDRAIGAVAASASDIAKAGMNVISGYARGVDTAAHKAALETSGYTTMVLAEGILKFTPRAELRNLATPYNTLVLSEFPPRMPWSVGNAMKRNSTICAFADAMVVVESKLTGGTYAAGVAALELGRPLFVVDYGDNERVAPGNRYFIDHGASPLRRHRLTGLPITKPILEAARRQAGQDSSDRAEWSPKAFMLTTHLEAADRSPVRLGLWDTGSTKLGARRKDSTESKATSVSNA